jgi:virulence-associated protein VapD
MGFDYSPQLNGWENTKLALETYKELHGDLLVPSSFIVPTNDSAWPEEIWDMKLGLSVYSIRNQNSYADYKEELAAMGFNFNSQLKYHGWNNVKTTLNTYKQLHGNLLVTIAYLVPQGDKAWPEELWGIKLGSTVASIRNQDAYKDHREELEAMGFDYGPQQPTRQRWERVELALEIYKKLHGDLLIPTAFVVPTGDSAWPEHLWGMKLGGNASKIRCGATHVRHRKKLEAMGFSFDSRKSGHSKVIKKGGDGDTSSPETL